jgi:hypothetical protein
MPLLRAQLPASHVLTKDTLGVLNMPIKMLINKRQFL